MGKLLEKVVGLTRVHGGGAIDDASYAATVVNDLAKCGVIELVDDVEVEVLLVGEDAELQNVVEVIVEAQRCASRCNQRVEVVNHPPLH